MNPETPDELIQRFSPIDWSAPPKQRRSQAILVQEFLRRTAFWSDALPESRWPFYDYAEEIDPEIRATQSQVDQMQAALPVGLSIFAKAVCEYALHFRALQQQKPLPFNLPEPFEPIIMVFERGSSIRKNEGPFIEVDFRYVNLRSKSEWLTMGPVVDLDPDRLNAIDEAES